MRNLSMEKAENLLAAYMETIAKERRKFGLQYSIFTKTLSPGHIGVQSARGVGRLATIRIKHRNPLLPEVVERAIQAAVAGV